MCMCIFPFISILRYSVIYTSKTVVECYGKKTWLIPVLSPVQWPGMGELIFSILPMILNELFGIWKLRFNFEEQFTKDIIKILCLEVSVYLLSEVTCLLFSVS